MLEKGLRLLVEDPPYLSSFGSQQKYSLPLFNKTDWGKVCLEQQSQIIEITRKMQVTLLNVLPKSDLLCLDQVLSSLYGEQLSDYQAAKKYIRKKKENSK